jgi:S-adenosylmethionine:tRNA ribosyltransferase-isomerase
MHPDFDIHSYRYDLPPERIAQHPPERREESRLLVLHCNSDTVQDRRFTDIPTFFSPGDMLVVNDTRVFPARLEGRKKTGGKAELFLLEYPDFTGDTDLRPRHGAEPKETWQDFTVVGLLKSSKKARPGTRFFFSPELEAELLQYLDAGRVEVKLCFKTGSGRNPEETLATCGRIPLPPYIQRDATDHPQDRERYQTLFARRPGAVAAPTAGLHFSDFLLRDLEKKGVHIAAITLHVGYGTFAPVRAKDIRDHRIHEEYIEVGAETAAMINQTRAAGRRVWTVGTTTARTLEFAADAEGRVTARKGWCGLYIYPGYRFKVVNGLVTNFHLPESSLLFLVAALAGRQRILGAYDRAIRLGYRFYSYGDAMLIIC